MYLVRSPRQAILFIVLREVSDQPPTTSIDSGKKINPASWQSASWAASLRSSTYVNVKMCVSAAFEIIVDCRDDIILTSDAARFPCVREVKIRSGLVVAAKIFLSEGLRLSERQEEKTLSIKHSWGWISSPRPPHVKEWSLYRFRWHHF